MIRIGICDDSQEDLTLLKNMLARVCPNTEVRALSRAGGLLDAVDGGADFSVVFLDLYMPEMKGTDLAREIRLRAPDTDVIFVSNSADGAVDAFSIKALHYVLKPITEPALRDCLSRVQDKEKKRPAISVKSQHSSRLVYLDEITCCESAEHYFRMNLKSGVSLPVRMTQEELLQSLGGDFLLLSRGMIVNMAFIQSMASKSCVLKDGRELLLSRKSAKAIRDAYDDYIFRMLEDS